MRYFLSVGEASADLHASNLMKAIRAKDPEAVFAFTGGDMMAAIAGKAPIVHYREMAFMGFIPVLMHLGRIRRFARRVQEEMKAFGPDIVIAVDYAGFNLRYLLPYAKDVLHLPTAYYILPKVWAWKKYRLPRIKQYTDLPLSILPFEPDFFRAHGYEVAYVGNPCLDAVSLANETQALPGHVADKEHTIALLPGSRKQELKANLPIMLEALRNFPDYKPVIAGAPGLTREDYLPYLQHSRRMGGQYPEPDIVFGHTYELLAASRAAVVTSGTATLETALIGCPQVVCYNVKGGRIINYLFEHFFSVRYFSLANLIVDAPIVPELLAGDFTTANLSARLSDLLMPGQARDSQLQGYEKIRQAIGSTNCSDRAAEEIILFLRSSSVSQHQADVAPELRS